VRVTILTYVEAEGSDEIDLVVPQLEAALKAGGHDVSVLATHADLKKLVSGLEKRKPDLVFNVLEEFAGRANGNLAVAGVLDALPIPYTGCSPSEYYLGQDKVLAKKLLAFEHILTPRFAVFGRDQGLETGGNLRLPMFVKPVSMDGSIGIDKRSLVEDATAMMKRVLAIHDELKDDALVEEYIPGREFYVGILGNDHAIALPPIEVDFSALPDTAPRIYCRRAKWEPGTLEHTAIKTRIAEIPDELRARLHKVSLDAYRALRVRDYGRVDLRVADTGEIYVLEVNAACYLEQHDEFAVAAEAAGIGYNQLIARIVDLAVARTSVEPARVRV
jgi:D-alanine-D-alanine ligase